MITKILYGIWRYFLNFKSTIQFVSSNINDSIVPWININESRVDGYSLPRSLCSQVPRPGGIGSLEPVLVGVKFHDSRIVLIASCDPSHRDLLMSTPTTRNTLIFSSTIPKSTLFRYVSQMLQILIIRFALTISLLVPL